MASRHQQTYANQSSVPLGKDIVSTPKMTSAVFPEECFDRSTRAETHNPVA